MTVATWADPSATWADPTATWAYAGVTDLEPTFEWSPSTAPGATPVWEDITSLVRSGSISRGRQSEFDRTSAGRLALDVDNRDRTFDPVANAEARPNVRIRATVGSGVDLVSLFDGWIDSLPQAYQPPADATVTLTATDGFKALARHELDAIYAPIIEADGPYVWWRLADDLPLALTAVDSWGNGNDGAIKGAPSSTQSLLTDGPGAMSFGGTTDPDEGSADGVIGTATIADAPLSVEAWVRTGKYGTNLSFICGQTHTAGSTFVIDAGFTMDNSTSIPSFQCQVGGINATLSAASVVMRDTGVHHLVGTVDSSRNARFYVDGVLVAGPTATGSTTTVDASGSVRVAKTPVAADPGSGSSYKSFKGDVCEFATYERALSAAEVLEHYTAGGAPWDGDTTGARVARILDLVGWPAGDRDIEAGASTLGAATGIEGRSALDHLLAVEQTEQGRFFIAGDGTATFFSRNHETSLTPQAAFTDDDVADLAFDFSDTNLTNDCTVTRVGGLPQRAQDQTSIDASWRMSDAISGVLYSTDNEALAMAQWRVENYSTPTLRPEGLTFQPYRDLPNMYDSIMVRELGDRISVTRTLAGTDITVDAVIEGIVHRFRPGVDWVTAWNLSPLTFGQFGPGGGNGLTYLTLNNATTGQLDNNNRLGF